METQENKNSEKKEITYPKFIQERLDRIPWEELESQYGIKKDYIMSREQIARQLANGQVTDYVNCYARVGNLTVMGPMALQANFRGDRVEVKHIPSLNLVTGNHLGLINYAHAEASNIVFTLGIEASHLCSFAAD